MLNKIKKVSIRDILGIFKFLIVLLPSIIYRIYLKIYKKELWLICETELTARDNGYVFFEYIKNNHPEINCYYAISFKANDYNKVKKYKNIIKWASLKHYFYYISSTKNISSHKEGNPNQTLFTILHLFLNMYNNRVFLQHGILYQNLLMFHQQNTKFKLFISGAKPEYEFLKSKYEYKNDEIKYTGLARFDNLYKNANKHDKNLILYMPTWRRWFKNENEFINSKYFKYINSVINNKDLDELLKNNNMKLIFCPHIGIKKYNSLFKTKCNNIEILNVENVDIQKLLIKGGLLITDFSSIHTDFAYMKKPIIYYQYDMDEARKRHIGTCAEDTYFDYKRDGFGVVVEKEEDLITELAKYCEKLDEYNKYLERVESFFEYYDDKNSERIYNEIINLKK